MFRGYKGEITIQPVILPSAQYRIPNVRKEYTHTGVYNLTWGGGGEISTGKKKQIMSKRRGNKGQKEIKGRKRDKRKEKGITDIKEKFEQNIRIYSAVLYHSFDTFLCSKWPDGSPQE